MSSRTQQHDPPELVRVLAPARLHMGFLDLHGGLGRRFGSIGLTLESIATSILAYRSTVNRVSGVAATARAGKVLDKVLEQLGRPGGVEIRVDAAIPEHVGLGSGTQLALAIGMAASQLYGVDWKPAALAHRLDRGARSGIGVGAFAEGGFILDGGRGEQDAPPPVLATFDFPEHWRVLLIMDQRQRGLHGGEELDAFRALPRFPAETAAHLCRVTLMQLLPALREADLTTFAEAVWELQCRVGDHFAPAQGGRFTSSPVANLLEEAAARKLPAGQSSWGPTGFVVFPDEQSALGQRDTWAAENDRMDFLVCRARNNGGELHAEQLPRETARP
jgi:beta-ribofuranosylaminobenzene 5'-phosphate synthase